MLQEFCAARLHQLLDSAFTSSHSLLDWLRDEKPLHVAQLCVALNLEAAQRALPIAEKDFHSNVATLSHATFSASFLQSAHLGQENANVILKTLRYVHASVHKGLMLANAHPTLSRNVTRILRKFSRYIFACIVFWTSHRIYDPSQINSFIIKINNLYGSYPDIFEVDNLNAPANEANALAKLFHLSHDAEVGTLTEHGWRPVPQSGGGNRNGLLSHKDSDSLSQMSHKHHFGFYLPHIHIGIPNIGPSVSHVLAALDVRHAHWSIHVKVPHLLHHPPPPTSSIHGHTVEEIFERTELALHFIAAWATHEVQSPTTAEILKKLTHEQIGYVKAIDSSLDAAESLANIAAKAHELVGGLSKESEEDDVENYRHDMEKLAPDFQQPEKCVMDFRHVRQAVNTLRLVCDEEYLNLQHIMGDRIFELKRSRDILDLFHSNIDLYVDWWTRLNMSLTDFKDMKKQEEIAQTGPNAKMLLLGEWETLRQSVVHYVEKMSELKPRFPLLFQEARDHVDLADPS